MNLGINIDHVATLRQARKVKTPTLYGLQLFANLPARFYCMPFKEDRRHIQDRDVYLLKQVIKTRLNLEMAPSDEIIK